MSNALLWQHNPNIGNRPWRRVGVKRSWFLKKETVAGINQYITRSGKFVVSCMENQKRWIHAGLCFRIWVNCMAHRIVTLNGGRWRPNWEFSIRDAEICWLPNWLEVMSASASEKFVVWLTETNPPVEMDSNHGNLGHSFSIVISFFLSQKNR